MDIRTAYNNPQRTDGPILDSERNLLFWIFAFGIPANQGEDARGDLARRMYRGRLYEDGSAQILRTADNAIVHTAQVALAGERPEDLSAAAVEALSDFSRADRKALFATRLAFPECSVRELAEAYAAELEARIELSLCHTADGLKVVRYWAEHEHFSEFYWRTVELIGNHRQADCGEPPSDADPIPAFTVAVGAPGTREILAHRSRYMACAHA